jgi:hypothetical protein
MTTKQRRRLFWPLFVGVVVAVLSTKTSSPSIVESLADGALAGCYVLAALFAFGEKSKGAKLCRAIVFTIAVGFILYVATSLGWTLVPLVIVVFIGSAIFFMKFRQADAAHR